jgi:hypothetical protein
MRSRILLGFALSLVVACGGGGGDAGGAKTVASPSTPSWQVPVDLVATGYAGGATLAGDGKGEVVAAWLRSGIDGGGTAYWEQVAARLRADGTWEAAQALEASYVSDGLKDPVLALDDRGKGLIAWLSPVPRAITTALRTVPVDLLAATPFGARSTALALDLKTPADLRLTVGSDGSALAAWMGLRSDSAVTDYPTVQASRLGPGGAWGAPASYHLNMFSHQGIDSVGSDGKGGFLLEFATGDDAWRENEAVAFAPGTGLTAAVPGWQPLSQQALPAAHQTAWELDAQGNLEAWLLYPTAGEGDPQRQAWPRTRSAAGAWTAGDKVGLPLPAQRIALFRGTGGGWVAGLGSGGLWVAPLTGLAVGTPKTLLPAGTTTEVMVGARDASGRPALLWIQRGIGGVAEGIGWSRWDGTGWTAPAILPGTAGKGIQRLLATAGPAGLLAAWVEVGDRTLLFRTALWK